MATIKQLTLGFAISSSLVAAAYLTTSLISPEQAQTAIIDAPTPLLVKTHRLTQTAGYEVEETYSGQLKARRSSELGFEQGGLLKQMWVDEGEQVQEGQLLAQLDSRRLIAQRAVIKAKINSSKAGLQEAKAESSLAMATVDRQKRLAQSGRISKQALEESQANAKRSQAKLAAARAQLKQAGAELEALEVSITLTQINAPYSGKIAQRHLDEGAAVAPGQVVLSLMETSQLKLI